MSDWTSGYVADISYTYGYYAELNPLRIALGFINAGIRPPNVINACELGFGQGISTNIHAAASQINWYGTDFNPHQAAFAQELSSISGADAKLHDDAFNEFCQRDDLPEFDYIGLHGIWSWISDENRAVIVDFIRRKLKVGGVLYISYNTQPGWAAMVPMRDLLAEHADLMSAQGAGTISRIEDAITFAEQLVAVNPEYCKANPQIKNRLDKIKQDNKNYVAHEYFNRDWEPMAFAKMARWLEPAKMDWACSARYADAIDSIQLTSEQLNLINSIPNPVFRQSVRDFCENRQFRTDYWVKGARRLSTLDQDEMLDGLRVVMGVPRKDVQFKIAGRLGNFDLPSDIYEPLLEVLSAYQPVYISELWQAAKEKGVSRSAMNSAVAILAAKGAILPAQSDESIAQAVSKVGRLNRFLMSQSRSTTELSYLASPVTGGGLAVPLFHQFFLLATLEGADTAKSLATFAWRILASQNKCLLKDGKPIASQDENLAELERQAGNFLNDRLPLYQALKII
ncbi:MULTISPECIES: class I SAM-dependent methyltransferase [Vreelandella]|uniref:Methyltransferase n=2 Tax=Vreelandella TaxID=3137766 RepID=A0A7C9NS67_9GAMM|nr:MULTISPECIES: class I SAM-dependent methyltransferase [Halomonas]NDL71967.1 methyltransferase [Halomonas alkaliphila]NYS46558.1 methyltransferase regulatory domain-containing protein [Halomonas zhaodongensis]